MASTDLIVIEADGFIALQHDLDEVSEFIHENLDGQDIGEFDLTRLRVPSGKATKYRWEIPTLDGSEVVDEIQGIIVSQKQTRGYWPLSIDDGGGNTPPVCASADGRTGVGKPWANKLDPNPDGDPTTQPCKQCPHSRFGSAEKGDGQACKQSSSLFLLMETGFLPAVVSVPPTSLASVKQYMLHLANHGIRFNQVITSFTLEKESNAGGTEYARIQPKLAGRLDPDAAEKAKAYGAMLAPTFDRVAAEQATGEPEPAAA